MAKELQVTVPDIGDYKGVPVIEILVKPGDVVAKDDALMTLESDKATLDVPAPAAGVIKRIGLKIGDKVSQGDAVLVLELEGAAESAPAAPAEVSPASAAAPAASAAVAPPVAAASAVVNVLVPDIGDYKDVPVIDILVKDGDVVEKDATLMTLESDKATLDVPAPAAGTVVGFLLKIGDKVSKGAAVCTLQTTPPAAATTAPAPVVAAAAAAPTAVAAPVAVAVASPPPAAVPSADGAVPYASPSIRKFARELGVDLGKVSGSGIKGRITLDDVQAFVKKTLAAPPAAAPVAGGGIPPIPAVDFSQFGPIESKPLARIRKLSAAHLHRAWVNIPHVTQTDEADITELEAFRKAQNDEAGKEGVKLTLLPFILKAIAKSMAAYPEFNASLAPDGESLIMKQYLHLGFAADTPNGLVVPVVRDVDKKGINQLALETAELAKKARDGKLKPDEMKGGCFSVSSLGGIGGSHFTPIVNAPEVGILGVSRSTIKPVWDGKAFQPRLMVPLSLSYDHRVIDGAYAARFIVQLVRLLSDVRRLAL
ncbi:MAG: dihydrolipoyllysine-residue acetyltransferase [Nevskia sp.]|jgi:pyruvate dehydrogenase E2 component (dihydrolipoamide acetyltransferase)|nr:dihydrolipoyllysine-residue acetyltransferase [Nevskia sp.]MCK9384321.1 dihydrolipoyllysine-residue acetyltransferase [Nevskia sp.]